MTMHAHEQQVLIKQSCMDFVKFKDGLDLIGKNQQSASTLERLGKELSFLTPPHGEEWTAIHPAIFCSKALPFSDPVFNYASMVPEDIDPRLVMAGTYKNYSPSDWRRDIDPNRVMASSNAMVDDDDRFHHELPRVAKIGNLPLYVALEGKNRVALFKRYRVTMRAMVTKTFFPPPQDLRLVRLWPFGVHALKHGMSTEILPFPAYTLPLLEAYGVPKGKGVMDFPAAVRFCKKRKHICSQQMCP